MKYLRLFDTHADYQDFTETQEFILPNVSRCRASNDVHYNPVIIESLASIANLGENPDNVLWTPTSDELMYIQATFDALDSDSVDWSEGTLYVSKDNDNYNIWGNNIKGWQIAVDFNYKIDHFYQPQE